MQKIKNTHRSIALFFVFTMLLPNITSLYQLRANNNGPNAPEAASFEPVDATDMVNLLTGDFSYVLPLMNIPSPEGGYPIALAYHGGIPMDLESSWVGLGWNLNPGAINRTVNGYPDDYSNTKVTDYFYDQGETITSSYFSISYMSYTGVSVGVNASWGSHQSTAGSVSVGFGFPKGSANVSVGTNGVSVGVGYNFGALSLGASVSTNGKAKGNVGLGFDSNGTGFKIGASTDGTYSLGFSKEGNDRAYSLGVDFSSEGASLSVGVSKEYEVGGKTYSGSYSVGIGPNTSFSSTFDQGDYTTNRSGNNISLFIPTNVGVFGFSFGSERIKIFAAKETNQLITGPLNFGQAINSDRYYSVKCVKRTVKFSLSTIETFSNLTDAELYKEEKENTSCNYNTTHPNYCYECDLETVITAEAYMDSYEIPISEGEKLSSTYDITLNNPVFPSYDKYNVQAQGLSGSIHATLIDNGRLFGLSKEFERYDGLTTKVNYEYDGLYNDVGELDDNLNFRDRPEFYFDNEISTYLATPKANFSTINSMLSSESIQNAFNGYNFDEPNTNRFKKSNYIEYATNEELIEVDETNNGFLETNANLDRSTLPNTGIGAYKITAPDGKTYHYSLPVYNHETVTRTYGSRVSFYNSQECEAYIEKRQLEPYATHWLLTAVTGPDFVDNGDGIANQGDLGYWVNFDYGLWSDAYVWSPHANEDYMSQSNGGYKTWIKGRKQLYYLDKISTRTHSAVFIKSEDNSNPSLEWQYKSVAHDGSNQNCGTYSRPALPGEEPDYSALGIDFVNVPYYQERFNIPSHSRLKLDRILLVKNENFNLSKNGGVSAEETLDIVFNDSKKESQEAKYNQNYNVYDITDNWEPLRINALKVIELDQDYSLSNNQLTLQTVDFKGKKGANVLPSYQFEYYIDNSYTFNKEDANDWGYYKNDSKLWSLKEIQTPQGAKIEVEYDNHQFSSVTSHDYKFNSKTFYSSQNYTFEVSDFFNFTIGERLYMEASFVEDITIHDTEHDFDNYMLVDCSYDKINYAGEVEITNTYQQNEKNYVTVSLLSNLGIQESLRSEFHSVEEVYVDDSQSLINERVNDAIGSSLKIEINDAYYDSYTISDAGPRVRSIKTTNGIETYTSKYAYGVNENGVGWVSYVPFAPNAQEEVPYSNELPSPRPMYEYVTLSSIDANGMVTGKTEYQFNVIKSKTEGQIKYADLYDLNIDRNEEKTSGSKTVKVNEYTVHDNLNNIGQLLSVSTYNSKNQLLSKLENEYYQKNELPDDLGITQESYQSYKKIIENEGESNEKERWLVNSSTRVKYPNLLKSSTELKNGVTYTTTFSDFDPISGQARETYSKSSLGLEIKTESIPAFHKYPEMGSKVDDITNKNMLSQATQTLSYFKEYDINDWQLYGAEVDTWAAWDNEVWRKHQSYIWEGAINANGSYKDYVAFNWNSDTQAEEWSKIAEITKYSDYSKPLETEDINGNKASRKLGDNQSKVTAVCNAPYNQMFYEGFEYSEDFTGNTGAGGVSLYPVTMDATRAHTGKSSFRVSEGNGVLFTILQVAGSYKASVWVYKDNYENTTMQINNTQEIINYNSSEVIEAGDWVQLNFYFETPVTGQTIVSLYSAQGETYYDDFRMHPTDTSMTSYVYNEWDELTHIIGTNNMSTKFEYDDSGRLHKTYTEVAKNASTEGGFKLINETNYNYKNL